MKNIFLFLIPFFVLFCSGCGNTEDEIHRQINEANYCETKRDCVNIGSKCPFGCYIYVHQNEAERIRKLVDDYDSECVYDCIACEDVACVNNTCKAMCE